MTKRTELNRGFQLKSQSLTNYLLVFHSVSLAYSEARYVGVVIIMCLVPNYFTYTKVFCLKNVVPLTLREAKEELMSKNWRFDRNYKMFIKHKNWWKCDKYVK